MSRARFARPRRSRFGEWMLDLRTAAVLARRLWRPALYTTGKALHLVPRRR